MPRISVIVPVYNVDRYLEQCLQSLCDQTMNDLEFVVVNDGSTDSSLEIIRHFESTDDRFIVIDKPNGGYGSAINCGLNNAIGDYIAIVESDDFILPNMFQRLYETVEEHEHTLDFVKSDIIRFYGDGAEDDCKPVPIAPQYLYNRVLHPEDNEGVYSCFMVNVTGIYKRSYIEEHHIRLNESKGAAFQDNGLWFQLFMYAQNIMFIPEAFYMYRQDREDSSTNTLTYEKSVCVFKEFEFIHNVLKNTDEACQEKNWPVYIARFCESMFYHYGRILEDYKVIFLRMMSDALNRLEEERTIDWRLLSSFHASNARKVMEDPITYYYKDCAKRLPALLRTQAEHASRELDLVMRNTAAWNREFMDKEKQPMISVIIPVYNAASHIDQCMKSVLSQTLTDIEVLCVDDGSTDTSLMRLFWYLKQDFRVHVTTQVNAGAGAARNTALQVARGEYVIFMDPDDYYYGNDVLEKLYKTAKEQQVKVCGGSFIDWVNNELKDINPVRFETAERKRFSEYQQVYGFQSFLIERDLLVRENIIFPDYRRYQDVNFFAAVLQAAEEFYCIPDVIYVYRYTPNHVQWNSRKVLDLVRGITDLLFFAHEYQLEKLYYFAYMQLESAFRQRIVQFWAGNTDVIRYLVLAESRLDHEMLERGSEGIYKYGNGKLRVLFECINLAFSASAETRKKLQDAQNTITSLQKEKAARWQELQELRKQKEERYQQIQTLQREKNERWRQIQTLQKEKNEHCQQIKMLQKDKAERWQQIQVLQKEKNEHCQQIKMLQKDKAERWQQIQTLQKEKNEHCQQIKMLQKDKAERWQQIQALQKEKNTFCREAQDLRKRNDEHCRQIQMLQKEKAERWQEIQTLQKEKADRWQEIQTLQKEKAERWQEIQTLQKEKADRWQEIQTLRKENSQLIHEMRPLRKIKKIFRMKNNVGM